MSEKKTRVVSERRREHLKKRWADPVYAKRERARLSERAAMLREGYDLARQIRAGAVRVVPVDPASEEGGVAAGAAKAPAKAGGPDRLASPPRRARGKPEPAKKKAKGVGGKGRADPSSGGERPTSTAPRRGFLGRRVT